MEVLFFVLGFVLATVMWWLRRRSLAIDRVERALNTGDKEVMSDWRGKVWSLIRDKDPAAVCKGYELCVANGMDNRYSEFVNAYPMSAAEVGEWYDQCYKFIFGVSEKSDSDIDRSSFDAGIRSITDLLGDDGEKQFDWDSKRK